MKECKHNQQTHCNKTEMIFVPKWVSVFHNSASARNLQNYHRKRVFLFYCHPIHAKKNFNNYSASCETRCTTFFACKLRFRKRKLHCFSSSFHIIVSRHHWMELICILRFRLVSIFGFELQIFDISIKFFWIWVPHSCSKINWENDFTGPRKNLRNYIHTVICEIFHFQPLTSWVILKVGI